MRTSGTACGHMRLFAPVPVPCSHQSLPAQDVLQQLLRLGALADVPDDLQWTARMLLPKSAACPPPAAPRNPPHRPSPPAAWAREPGAAAALQQPVARPSSTDVTARPAAPRADVSAPALQPLPLPANPTAFGAPQQHALVGPWTVHRDRVSRTTRVLCNGLKVMLADFLAEATSHVRRVLLPILANRRSTWQA